MQGMFKIGDRAVYPAQGVTEIQGIETKDICGNQEIFYVLKVLDTEKRIMVPVNKVRSVGLRENGGGSFSDIWRVFRRKRQRQSH